VIVTERDALATGSTPQRHDISSENFFQIPLGVMQHSPDAVSATTETCESSVQQKISAIFCLFPR
jgi:hypothetical protein